MILLVGRFRITEILTLHFRAREWTVVFLLADQPAAVETGTALVILYSPDLEQSLQKVKEAGGTISKEIFSFPGGRRFHFKEPGGSELAIWSDKGLEE